MAKLTDKKKKQMIADYIECGNYSAVAKKHKVSRTTVRNAVMNDSGSCEKFRQKKEENTRDILAYMETKRDLVCDFIDLYMKYLTDPKKLEDATLSQISTAFGTVVDKFTKLPTLDIETESTGVVLLPPVEGCEK